MRRCKSGEFPAGSQGVTVLNRMPSRVHVGARGDAPWSQGVSSCDHFFPSNRWVSITFASRRISTPRGRRPLFVRRSATTAGIRIENRPFSGMTGVPEIPPIRQETAFELFPIALPSCDTLANPYNSRRYKRPLNHSARTTYRLYFESSQKYSDRSM